MYKVAPHGTAFDLTVNAWPALKTGTPPEDSDHDGMPDEWEKTNGLNPNDANDSKKKIRWAQDIQMLKFI